MSKIFLVFFLLLLQIAYLPKPTLAAASCASQGIDYTPKIFVENPGSIVLNFTISNPNTRNTLDGKKVWVHIGDVDSNQQTVGNPTFTLTLDDDKVEQKRTYSGSLHWESTPGQTGEFCSQVDYQVGAGQSCTPDPKSIEIPPLSSLTIRFVGAANRTYSLVRATGGSSLGSTTTDAQGQGRFDNIFIGGDNGENIRLTIMVASGGLSGAQSCHIDIKITSTAPPPPVPGTGPVIPTQSFPAATACTDPAKCSKAGGDPCKTPTGKDNPGIGTAIGCIHTSPAAFVKDFLTFIIAISGGLAFLMMLLGAFQMLSSAGNPETLAAGKDRFTSAIIGLLFIIFAVLLMQIIGVGILNIPGFK